MKTAFTRKLMAVLVAALMITALTVVFATVSSAALTPVEIGGTGWAPMPAFTLNPGVELDEYLEDEDNGDIAFDLALLDGYMIDDPDLHDGYVPTDFTVLLKTTKRDGSTEFTPLLRQTTGDATGYFYIRNFNPERMDVVVLNVSKIVRTIDGKAEEDFVFEADGHTYNLTNAALYGNVVILNGQNDFTKVFYNNAEVDYTGKIMTPDSGSYISYMPNIKATGSFANYGTLSFNNATGMDNATKANALYFYENESNTGLVVNHGTINVNTRDVYFLCRTFTNSETGVINVNNNITKTADNSARLYIVSPTKRAGTLNSGEINLNRGELFIGGTFLTANTGDTDPVYDSNFTNDATVKSCGVLTVTGTFKNTKNGTIDLYSEIWTNAITGAINAGGLDAAGTYLGAQATGRINLTGKFNMQPEYADAPYAHVNNGTIIYDDDYIARGNYFFSNNAQFVNNGTMLFKTSWVAQSGADGSAWDTNYAQIMNKGKIINNGTFTVDGYRFKFFINQNDEIIEIGLPYASISKNKEYEVMPLGIENNGDMIVVDVANAGTIDNNGNFTLNGLLSSDIPYAFPANFKVYDDCNNCPGHDTDTIAYDCTGDFNNYAQFTNNAEGRFTTLYNEGTIDNNGAIKMVFVSENNTYIYGWDEPIVGKEDVIHHKWEFTNKGTLNNIGASSSLINYGLTDNFGTINSEGSITNFDEMIVEEGGIINSARFENTTGTFISEGWILDTNPTSPTYGHGVWDEMNATIDGFLTVAGKFVNNGTFLNDWYCDVRVEGEFDNVDGMFTNKGMLVNVGTFTTTVEGMDNQFAIEGYDLTYVNKADTQTPADDTTKAPAANDTTKAPADTKAPTKTPAAQTSDVAVAGFAILATLALAGVVVAKKVR